MRTITLFFLVCAFAVAGPFLTLWPDSNLVGYPGYIVSWNLEVTNDEYYVVVSSVEFLSIGSIGTFEDIFSPYVPVIGPDQREEGPLMYEINLATSPGDIVYGMIVVTYDLFACNPTDTDCDTRSQQIGFGLTTDTPASVAVGSESGLPEPSTFWLSSTALAGLWLVRRRSRR